jgi:hypothetical protein
VHRLRILQQRAPKRAWIHARGAILQGLDEFPSAFIKADISLRRISAGESTSKLVISRASG